MTTHHPPSYYHHYNSAHTPYRNSRYMVPTYEPREYYPKPIDAPHTIKPMHEKLYKRKTTCCDSLCCCGCFVCCPRPCRWLTCIIFLLLLGFIACAAVLISLFKKPSASFTEMKGIPNFNLKGSNATVGFELGFTVDNPNFEGMMFKAIDSVIYYDSYKKPIGNGHLENVYISPNEITNITYPILLSVDILKPEEKKMFTKLLSQCSEKSQNIKLKYEITATASILGIGLPIPYNSHISFQCPATDQSSVLLKDLNSVMNSPKVTSVLPKIFSALPTATNDLPLPSGIDLDSILSGIYPTSSASI